MLEGKVALVTGAGQGIGKEVALRLAREGANIVAADLKVETARATAVEVQGLGRNAMGLAVDVREVSHLQAMVDAAVGRLGRIDILVACAGVVQMKRALDITEGDWDRVFDVNCKGLFFTNQIVARQMVKQGSGGAIVNLSSASARGPRPLQAHYGASKAAVIHITWTLAAVLAPDRIRVNCLCPGIVETPMWDQIDQEMAAEFGVPLGEFRKQRLSAIPLGRLETAGDVADAVAFLVSPQASYITGQSLNVDGGFQMN